MRPRHALAATGAVVFAAATAASALGAGPLAASQVYELLHGGIGEQASAQVGGLRSTPQLPCAPGSRRETDRQGRVPLRDYENGRAARGYTCNATDIGREGDSGGFQVHRYVDKAGHECAYYDGTALFPTRELASKPSGVVVLDMQDPRRPRRTTVLSSFAMRTPHESLRLNTRRGLLAAVAGSPFTQAGVVDVYDVSQDCRAPVLRSSLPLGVLGHEGAFSPDGRTYWAATTADRGLSAIDVSDPANPRLLYHGMDVSTHGLSISDDGRRAYLADVQNGPTQNYVSEITNGGGGMRILDISQIQDRVPLPQVSEVGYVTWPEVTIPQSTIPVTIKGRRYVVEFDEYDSDVTSYSAQENVGGVHVIDVSDERKPRLVSRIRLAVWDPAARATQADDPGASSGTQGYAAHYCNVPQRKEPGILACGMIASGLRVFDIRDPLRPREVAYVNHPAVDAADPAASEGAYAMSAPAFVPQRREVWYADANTGFRVVRLSPAAWPAPSRS